MSTDTQQIVLAVRRVTPRWWALAGACLAALVILYAVVPFVGVRYTPASAKLEALYAAMSGPLSDIMGGFIDSAHFRRTLAGAVVTLGGDRMTVERAPPRKNRLTTQPFGQRKPPKHR